LPGSLGYEPGPARRVDPLLASRIVWFDALVTNVDRTVRNPNLLLWHRQLYLIDHGAALYFHHSWKGYRERAQEPFTRIRDHVLLPYATQIREVGLTMKDLLTDQALAAIVSLIPDSWLTGEPQFGAPAEYRAAYLEYLVRRVAASAVFTEEAWNAHATLV
jgi:hypothetical protein